MLFREDKLLTISLGYRLKVMIHNLDELIAASVIIWVAKYSREKHTSFSLKMLKER